VLGAVVERGVQAESRERTDLCAASGYGADVQYGLLSAAPGERILVCGVRAAQVLDVTREWLQILGREAALTTQGCPNAVLEFVAAGIPLTSADPSSVVIASRFAAPTDLQPCGAAYAHTGPWAPLPVVQRGGVITLCPQPQDERVIRATYLHEVGHLLGLCDQDPSRAILCTGFHSNAGIVSIMNNGSEPLDLTADDVLAVRLSACRADVPANALWARQRPDLPRLWHEDAVFTAEVRRIATAAPGAMLPDCL
jgi:hypothetical protein